MDERPIDAPETTEQPTIAEPPIRTRTSAPNRTPWLAGGVAVLVLGAGVGIGLGLGGHGSGASPAASASPTSPATLSMFGSITVPFLGADLFAPQASDPDATGAPGIGDPCITAGGFTDISAGTAVTIGGPDGKTLTVTALEAGRVTGTAGSPAQCTFDFDASVPDDLSEYTVTISHRGTQVFTPEQVRSGGVDLTLNAS